VVLIGSIIAVVYSAHKEDCWKKFDARPYSERAPGDKEPSILSKGGWGEITVASGITIFFSVLLLVIFSIIYPAVRMKSTADVADLEAFHDSTVKSFEIAAEETETVTVYVSDQALIDAGYWGQGLAVSDRLAELRDKVDWYNRSLNRNRHWNSIWVTNGFTADAPEDLTYIEIDYNPESG
jgi:hypothetical protein